MPVGSGGVNQRVIQYLEDDNIPGPLKSMYAALLSEITQFDQWIKDGENEIEALTKTNENVRLLQSVPGIGLLSSTALVASIGSPSRFSSGRKPSSWVGLTPREHSSGNTRHLGGISKQGDCYVRILVTHGARSVLYRAKQLERTHKALTPLQRWASQLERRVGHNKATCAIANKLIRICWAVWTTQPRYNPNQVIA